MGEVIEDWVEMTEDEAVTMALSIPGLTEREEIQLLYRLALGAPEGLIFVELGAYQGRTAAILCVAAKEINSQVIAIDIESRGVEDRLSKLGFDARVIISDSMVVPKDLSQIGLLFIDSDHTRERLYGELDVWLPLLVQSGILAFHDYNNDVYGEVMTSAIDERIRSKTNEWEYLGLAHFLIGFRRL